MAEQQIKTSEIVELWTAGPPVPMGTGDRLSRWHSSAWALRWDAPHSCWTVQARSPKGLTGPVYLLTGVPIVAVQGA
jgi:hypothetical protein